MREALATTKTSISYKKLAEKIGYLRQVHQWYVGKSAEYIDRVEYKHAN